jgi:ABC-type ATPase involved in cell division
MYIYINIHIYIYINQKGVTRWMTGLSGSGKSTIAALLEESTLPPYPYPLSIPYS